MIRRLAPLFSLVLALGCGSPTGTVEPFVLDVPFWIKMGDTRVSADGGTAVHFVRVVTDSRCRADMVCVWGGEAIIEVEVFTPWGTSFDPAVAQLRGEGRDGAAADPVKSDLSIALPKYEVKVGAEDPVVADARRIHALALDPIGVGSQPPSERRARLRISVLPAP